ncbi:metallophosphoesterase [Lacinutrix sp. 5H-3-7-4]|uniref:metallophosphoesterase n=1 Tax=Lacinutrix sp. (strain 5H-3-7-4) TaxID=983544 RepID=UPI00020A3569|nr:metallophosphoesterase [Lacinutrix sp. 5H-3-7-4]AEH01728.1 metallophosphoesterase [Lacinutrix sp. 5H-3-7-4]
MKSRKHKYNFNLVSCFCVCLISFFGFAQQPTIQDSIAIRNAVKNHNSDKKEKTNKPILFNGIDGPYIIKDTLYRVTKNNKLIVSLISQKDSIHVKTDNNDFNEFYFSLKSNYTIPETNYELPEKIVVISDIEGKYDAFSSFLFANKIIDKDHNWIFGKGHLVLGGDFVDRGKNVTQVLWLIYKLEHQAKLQNGMVHFILGNHEILNFHGDYRYNRGKYIKAAQEISHIDDKKEALKYLYSQESELGKWLATKNVIEKIGDYLFVHAGLSPETLDYELSLSDINNLIRLRFDTIKKPKNKTLNFLYSPKGPFWYRGLVKTRFQYDRIKKEELDAILRYYDVKKIVIGHTPVNEISTDFSGKIIRTDVHHGYQKFSGDTKGLLIENGIEYIIDDKANKTLLKQ